MEYLSSFVSDEQTSKWVVALLVAAAVFLLCVALYIFFAGTFSPFKKRLREVKKKGKAPKSKGKALNKKIELLGKMVATSEQSDDQIYARQRLMYAGYGNKALSYYYGIKITLMVLVPGLVYLGSFFYPGIEAKSVLIIVASFSAFGMIAPSFFLDNKVAKRQRDIVRGFPDMLDLLIVCTEAGLGFEAGLDRVGKEIALSNSEISRELNVLNAEMRAGLDRETCLRNLYLRTGVLEIRSLVSVLTQSIRFGTSIADALRVYAEDMRDKRLQDAEEQAAKLSITLLFPLAFCFFPGIFIVILGPAMISVSKSLGGLGG